MNICKIERVSTWQHWQQYLNTSDFKKVFLFIGFSSIIIALLQKEVCLIQTQAFWFWFFLMRNEKMIYSKKKKGGGQGKKCKISSISIGSPELAVSSRKLFKSCCDLPTPACSSLHLGYVQSWSYRTPSLSSNCQESCADFLVRKETGQWKAPNTDNQKKSRKKEVRENKFPTFYLYLILSLKLFFLITSSPVNSPYNLSMSLTHPIVFSSLVAKHSVG